MSGLVPAAVAFTSSWYCAESSASTYVLTKPTAQTWWRSADVIQPKGVLDMCTSVTWPTELGASLTVSHSPAENETAAPAT